MTAPARRRRRCVIGSMSTWLMRRALGFQLNDVERQVGLFCAWLEARGQTTDLHDR